MPRERIVILPLRQSNTHGEAEACLSFARDHGLRRIEVDKGVAGGAPGAPAPFICIGHLYFDSVAAFQAAIAPHGKELFADVPNFTNITPQVQIAEIIHS